MLFIDILNNQLNLNNNEHHNFSNFPFFWVDEVKYNKKLIEMNVRTELMRLTFDMFDNE